MVKLGVVYEYESTFNNSGHTRAHIRTHTSRPGTAWMQKHVNINEQLAPEPET